MAAIQVDILLAGLRDTSGNPLAQGQVFTYSAGTTSAAPTWYDPNELNQAPNPIILDATGAAQVYAEGTYKFVIADYTGNVFKTWDNITFRTLQSSAWTVVPVAITYSSASTFTCTGDYTASFPANIAVQATIAGGPVQGWVTSSTYAGGTTTVVTTLATLTTYINGSEASVGPSPTTLPPLEVAGVIKPFVGFTAPTGYLLCDGTAYSRALYPALFAVSTISTTGTFTSASAVVTSIPSTTLMRAGMPISGVKIPAGTTILSVDSGTQITMSQAASASGGGTAFVVAPNGVGDGSTTFNVPDLRGRSIIGAGAGTGLTIRNLGATYGAETHTLSVAETPAHAHPGSTVGISDPSHTHGTTITSNDAPYTYGGYSAALAQGTGSRGGITTAAAYTGITATPSIASQGGGSAHSILDPVWTGQWIVKY